MPEPPQLAPVEALRAATLLRAPSWCLSSAELSHTVLASAVSFFWSLSKDHRWGLVDRLVNGTVCHLQKIYIFGETLKSYNNIHLMWHVQQPLNVLVEVVAIHIRPLPPHSDVNSVPVFDGFRRKVIQAHVFKISQIFRIEAHQEVKMTANVAYLHIHSPPCTRFVH